MMIQMHQVTLHGSNFGNDHTYIKVKYGNGTTFPYSYQTYQTQCGNPNHSERHTKTYCYIQNYKSHETNNQRTGLNWVIRVFGQESVVTTNIAGIGSATAYAPPVIDYIETYAYGCA